MMSAKGKRLLVLLVAILALGVGGLALAAFNGDPTPEEVLTCAVETLDAAQDGHAVLLVEADTPDRSGWATLEVWGKKPPEGDAHPKFRAEVRETSEAEAQGAVAVSDGEQFWLYVPARNTVWTGAVEEMRDVEQMPAYEGELPFDSPQTFVDWLLQVSEVTLLGTEEIGGREAYTLQFVPRPEELPEVAATGGTGTAWVDQARWVPLQAAFDGGSIGQGQVTAELVELDMGLSDDLFTFQIPDGVEVLLIEDRLPQHLSLDEAEADFDPSTGSGHRLLTPSYVPEGATLVDVMKMGDAIVLRYESAQGPFAVGQGTDGRAVEPPPASGEPVSLRGTTGTLFTNENEEGTKVFLAWTEDGRTFTVSGAISGEEALRVAESLQ